MGALRATFGDRARARRRIKSEPRLGAAGEDLELLGVLLDFVELEESGFLLLEQLRVGFLHRLKLLDGGGRAGDLRAERQGQTEEAEDESQEKGVRFHVF